MGNLRTINQYCGLDPFVNVTHDENNKLMHFPGCGVPKDLCTRRPCCEDARIHSFNSSTCGLDNKEYELFDPSIFAYKNVTTNC